MKISILRAVMVAAFLFVSFPAHAVIINKLSLHQASQARNPASYVDIRNFSAKTAESSTVPTDSATDLVAKIVVFSSTCDFYINTDGTAVIPSGDVTDGSGSVFKPVIYFLNGIVSTISVIPTTASCDVILEYYM